MDHGKSSKGVCHAVISENTTITEKMVVWGWGGFHFEHFVGGNFLRIFATW